MPESVNVCVFDALTAKLPAVDGSTEATHEEGGRLPDCVRERDEYVSVCMMTLGRYL